MAAVRNDRSTGKQKTIYMHRAILHAPANMLVDHENHNGLDNRKTNLRPATRTQNGANMGVNAQKKGAATSRFKGVHWHTPNRSWVVQISGRYIGCFRDEIDAARAYDRAALERFGKFAIINFPKEDYE